MFIFHEGLPRSGKSYEAMVKRIIPALKKGRRVYARLNGMDFDKIAESSGLAVERVRELLTEIAEPDVMRWAEIVQNDALVILDEMQNFWPHGGARDMGLDQIKAIAEHGHRGLDIVGMGQLLRGAGGVHPNWVNRCDQKIVFEKQNARGANSKYRWTAFKGMHDGQRIKFIKVNTGIEKYDPKYFGTYRTRVEGSENGETYQDNRTNIWTNPALRKWIPLVICAAAAAVWYLFYLFKGGGLEKSFSGKHTASATVAAPAQSPKAATAGTQAAATPPPEKKYEKDFIEDLSERYRIRVSAIIKSAKKQHAIFEWYDDSMHVKERLTMLAVAQLGYAVRLDDDMQYATITKGKVVYVATQFPNEADGRISDSTQRAIAGYPDRHGVPEQGGRVYTLDQVQGLRALDGVRQPGQVEAPQASKVYPTAPNPYNQRQVNQSAGA